MAFWLIKEEPAHYSYEDLVRDGKTRWDGVANNLALIHLRRMKKGDRAFFYATGKVKAVVGMVEVESDPYPDPREQDPKRVVVEVKPVEALPRPVPLEKIKASPLFKNHPLVRISRLSVLPVSPAERKAILALAGKK